VWRESQVKLLIDSVARNYPIGSLLTLTKSPQIPLHCATSRPSFRMNWSRRVNEWKILPKKLSLSLMDSNALLQLLERF